MDPGVRRDDKMGNEGMTKWGMSDLLNNKVFLDS